MLQVTPLPQALGAVVEGLDVEDLAAARPALLEAWRTHLVLFFPQLALTEQAHVALGSCFGRLAATSDAGDDFRSHAAGGDGGQILILDGARPEDRANAWHTDVTFTERPPAGSLLSMQVCPARGGDTLWSNQYAAYEALSPAVRSLIDDLDAVHGRPGLTGSTTHPMVLRHPVTGRRALYVNRGWTTSVTGLSSIESRGLLSMLFDHAEQPEFAVRWTWTAGDAALWDNHATMHYAVNDYGAQARVLHRVTIYEDAAVPAGASV